jgi:hypothetical protein
MQSKKLLPVLLASLFVVNAACAGPDKSINNAHAVFTVKIIGFNVGFPR